MVTDGSGAGASAGASVMMLKSSWMELAQPVNGRPRGTHIIVLFDLYLLLVFHIIVLLRWPGAAFCVWFCDCVTGTASTGS